MTTTPLPQQTQASGPSKPALVRAILLLNALKQRLAQAQAGEKAA